MLWLKAIRDAVYLAADILFTATLAAVGIVVVAGLGVACLGMILRCM